MHLESISTPLKVGFWPRGGEVSIREGRIHCPLALDRQYNLVKSRSYSPHVQFLKARSDQELFNFVRAWGPLYIVYGAPDSELERGISVRPVSQYRAFQRLLKALVDLLLSCGKGRLDGRKCLVECLAAEQEWDGFSALQTGEPALHFGLRTLFCPGMNLSEWIGQASDSAIRNVAAFVLETQFSAEISLSAEHDGKQFQITPKWKISTLREALKWMVWNDRLAFCQQCGGLFTVTPHRWKYDTDECAHKATDREWRRKKRKEERAERLRAEKEAKLKSEKKGRKR